MQASVIFAITQSVLAVIIVIGGGALLALGNIEAEAVTGIIGLVVGYFFGSGVQPAGMASVQRFRSRTNPPNQL